MTIANASYGGLFFGLNTNPYFYDDIDYIAFPGNIAGLTTENMIFLTTENGDILTTEG